MDLQSHDVFDRDCVDLPSKRLLATSAHTRLCFVLLLDVRFLLSLQVSDQRFLQQVYSLASLVLLAGYKGPVALGCFFFFFLL
jgi:hypothetical protein